MQGKGEKEAFDQRREEIKSKYFFRKGCK